jgi:hypothetical protein
LVLERFRSWYRRKQENNDKIQGSFAALRMTTSIPNEK